MCRICDSMRHVVVFRRETAVLQVSNFNSQLKTIHSSYVLKFLDEVSKRYLFCRQKCSEGNPDGHLEGGSTHALLWRSQSLGKDPGENGGNW
jgi:hypothetical protein